MKVNENLRNLMRDKDWVDITIVAYGHKMVITTNHASSSYNIPIIIVDDKITDAEYSPEIRTAPKNGHPKTIDAVINGETISLTSWAEYNESRRGKYIIYSLGFEGCLGTIYQLF